MAKLSALEITELLLALAILLFFARLFGELAKKFNQPSVIGEIAAGIFLGPTVIGALFPDLAGIILPTQGNAAVFITGFATVGVVLFMLVAGMEVDISSVLNQGKSAISISLAGLVIPFVFGLVLAWNFPELLGKEQEVDKMLYALFFAVAISISALPVIAKTLMDLNLYRTEIGMIIISSAIVDDLFGWLIFAMVLRMGAASNVGDFDITYTIIFTLAFAVGMLVIGRWALNKALPWIQAHTSWPGGVLGFCVSISLLGAAFTEWIGIHAVFGSFLVGVALGDSQHLRKRTRETLNQFISFIFAPIFFATVGLKINFIQHFDFTLTALILFLGSVGKIAGCTVGGRLSGMSYRHSLAVGFGMNARGAMEIILGTLALQYGIIGKEMFVSLVVIAIITSVVSGPIMQLILRRRKKIQVSDFISYNTFVKPLEGTSRLAVIEELARGIKSISDLEEDNIVKAAWNREQLMPTGLGNGVAIPHARIKGLENPIIGAGLSVDGVDFDAPDGLRANLVFLILTPEENPQAQIEILADISKSLKDKEFCERIKHVENYTEFRALLMTRED